MTPHASVSRRRLFLTWLAGLALATLPVDAFAQAGLHVVDDVPADADATSPDGPFRGHAVPLSSPREHLVGSWIPDVALTDVEGEPLRLSDLGAAPALAIIMRDVTCPVAKRYGPTLAELEKRFADRDVVFLYLNVSEHDTPQDIRDSDAGFGLAGRHVHDPEAGLARLLAATTTTEAFVLDSTRTLRFRGAIDDQYGIGFSKAQPGEEYLADALDALLRGADVAVPATTAPGCALELEPGDDALAVAPLTYHETISRVVQANCAACHHDGGVAPFPLDSYADLSGRQGMVRFVTEKGVMPPWHAEGGGPWLADRSLSARDRKLLLAWIDADCPEGDPATAPLPQEWLTEWQGGVPDAIVTNPESYRIPASGIVDYRYAYTPTDFGEDKWIRGFEIRPGANEVVHHVLVFVEEPQREDEPDYLFARRNQGGLYGYFAAYVPGQGPTFFGDGLAKKLPKDAWLKFQMHYTPNGTEVVDQTQIALYFADEPPEYQVRTSGVATRKFEIPAGADNVKVRAGVAFDEPSTLSGFSPHMHFRGKAFRYELYFPDGSRQVLLDVPRYDFNWQTMYRLAEPITVPAETQLICTAWYDNSTDNPANPDPSLAVYFGEQTWDEMMIGYFEWWQPDGG